MLFALGLFCSTATNDPQNTAALPDKEWSRQLLMVIGEQKCGTTYLHTLLKQHPAIVEAETESNIDGGWQNRFKEQHFWNEALRDPISEKAACSTCLPVYSPD